MTIKTLFLAAAAAAVIAGCAGNPTDEPDTVQVVQTPLGAAADESDDMQQATANAQTTHASELATDDRVCKKIYKTGTRLKTWVCATQEQWDATAEGAQRSTESMQKRVQTLDAP